MTEKEVKNQYFRWLCRFVYDGSNSPTKYDDLLRCMHDIPFVVVNPRDENRCADGTDLRYRFGVENNVPLPVISTVLDISACSFLEMLIALSLRCEESIMTNTDFGDRTSQWFWNMVVNLGLGKMTNEHFNEQETRNIIFRFMNREYGPNGEGGIVRVYDHGDLREVEIWYQVMWYLTNFWEGLK